MHYSIQPNEIAGFISLLDAANFYSQEKGEKRKWLERLPELKQTDFEKLVDFVREESLSAGRFIPLRKAMRTYLSKMNSVNDLKEFITKSPNPKIKADKINAMIDSVYPVYQKFYRDNEKILQNAAPHVNDLLNKAALEPLKQVGHFFNPDYQPKENKITVYMFPTSLNGHRGQNFHTQQADQQWVAFGADMLDGIRQIDIGNISSTIYHEKVHGLFHDSEADKKLSEYLKGDNKIVQILRDFPQLKRNPNVSETNEAEMMVNEAITSAFEGMLNEDVRGKKKNVLYENHVINKMAHKTIPLLREALKNGETFGPEFIKKFEKEFEAAVPEMLVQPAKRTNENGLQKTLSSGKIKEKMIRYSVHPNEMMGFLNMLTANSRQREKWKENIPELKGLGFERLTEFISQNDILNVNFFKKIAPENYSLEKFMGYIQENHRNSLKNAYNAYHSFYERSDVEKYAQKIEEKINSLGQDSFEQMAHFYGLKNTNNHITKAYALASIDGNGSCSLSGKEKSFQLLTLKMPVDKNTDIKGDVSKLFHETAHGILEDSGSEKVLNNYIDTHPNNPISQLMKDKPYLKRHETDDAKLMINEFMTTAFQKIFAADTLQKKTSYGDPTIAIMAEKLVPQIREAIEKGETFNETFLKKVEKTFIEAVPEIEKQIALKQEKAPIMARLSKATKEGKNDPQNQTSAIQKNTEKKTVFPKWLQNPSWLWHRNQQK